MSGIFCCELCYDFLHGWRYSDAFFLFFSLSHAPTHTYAYTPTLTKRTAALYENYVQCCSNIIVHNLSTYKNMAPQASEQKRLILLWKHKFHVLTLYQISKRSKRIIRRGTRETHPDLL